ncbi:MAG TPA: hypothetical protein VET46_00215 [Steroidobacteraceae bacterium]|nr:hypothetical protein [Steroidobacteraceae bacterium]
MSAPPPREAHRRPSTLDVALIVWPSFLAACVASLLFFATVDPELLRDAGPRLLAGLDREAGYALGFLFFWGIGALASTLSVYLIRTDRPVRRDAGGGAA